MTLRRVSLSSFLFLCFHLLAPLLYTTTDAALSSSILQAINCSTAGNYTATDIYAANVNLFLAALPENAVSKNGGFFNGTVGKGLDTVYGLAMCPADYSRADCSDCLTAAAGSNADGLPNRCPGSTTVLAMFDRCLVRYSNVNFFGTPEIGIVEALGGDMVRTSATYGQTVALTFKNTIDTAIISSQRFAATAGSPYVFVQCTWDLQADKCKQCLDVLSANATNMFGIRTEGQRKSYSCAVRYSNTSFMVVPFTAVSGPTPQSVGQTGISDHPSSASGSKAAVVGGGVTAVIGVICLAALICYVYKLRSERHTRDVLSFSYAQLAEATRNFAEDDQIGAGGFGAVYKGNVTGIREPVAIKKIKEPTKERAMEDFDNEIAIMRPLNHRNILRLVGWCKDRSSLLLVYELMENGNLEGQLYPRQGAIDLQVYTGDDQSTMPLLLDWHKRHNILVGIASGLAYLHSECKECLLHRDIKPGNVLLDRNFNAKLCDFGLVKQVSHTQTSATTENVRGTVVYIDPDYVDTSRACGQNDVYSFGILMLEVVCCERPRLNGTRHNLIERVWTCYQSNEILNAADNRLKGQFDDQIRRVLMIGLSCVQPERSKRPHIRRVMQCLTDETTRLPSVSTLGFIPLTLTETGSLASTSHNNNSTENVYSTCPTAIPPQSGVIAEDAGTTPFLSGP